MSTTPQRIIDWEWLPRFTIPQMFHGMVLTALAMWVVNRANQSEPWAMAVLLALGWVLGAIVLGVVFGVMAWVAGKVLAPDHPPANPFADGQLPPRQALPSRNPQE